MGRKKKSTKKDARGYVQGPAATTTGSKSQQKTTMTTTTSVSTKTHDDIKSLLGKLDNDKVGNGTNTANKTTVIPPSDRFVSKLSNVVDRLSELGFTDSQIEQAVQVLKYELTLDSALDWLCLHLNTMELPTLFTDGRLRDSLSESETQSGDSLQVLKAVKVVESSPSTEAKSSSNPDNIGFSQEEKEKLLQAAAEEDARVLAAKKAEEEKERQEQEERKRWLLQQYAYEEDVDDGEGADAGVNANTVTATEELSQQPLSPEELRLIEEEAKLKELESELKNDANNYMRSKAEMKQLQNQTKKQRQQVAGLRKKVERIKAKRVQEEQQAKAKEVEGEDDEDEEYGGGGGGMFDMFGSQQDDGDDYEEEEEEPPPVQTKPSVLPSVTTSALPLVKKLDYTIPKGWTGTTPQKKLEGVCKKQKLPRPKYIKLPPNSPGFRLTVTLKKKQPDQSWEAKISDFVRDSSLKDYLATQALYAMDPSLPLYQIFPPNFKDLWLSWLHEKQAEKDQIQQDQDTAKQQRIDYLMSLITSTSTDSAAAGASATTSLNLEVGRSRRDSTNPNNTGENVDVVDNWDDSDDDAADVNYSHKMLSSPSPVTTKLGKRMQEEFKQRQSSQPYKKMKEAREKLPMSSFRQQVLEMVQQNPVTILCAETGAGKTTQCPQYILEQAILDGQGDMTQIICTQPRRVAATSVSERVAEEMCDTLGKTVGYQIRMENKRSSQTRLLFCTTGVILRQLQDDPNLSNITHIIVDEVHERQQQTDVLLVILRQLLHTTRPDLKVILMSATMDSELFCSFFHGAPLISVPGRTFPVSNYYLEDLIDSTDHVIEEGSRYALRENRYEEKAALYITTKGGEKRKEVVDLYSQVDLGEVTMYPGYKMATRRSMERVNEEVINFDLVEDVLTLLLVNNEGNTSLVAPEGADLSRGSVLVFLPGLGEIKSMTERLEGNRRLGDKQGFEIIPMHSTLSSRDQRRAFVPARSGCRKIILSTNIAETSVTIPDVVCVIDCGRVREVRRNKRTSTSILVTDWCSKASSKQRAGRAGRVQPGLCLKMYSSHTAERIMKATSEPELRRVPLEEVCLNILASGFAKNCMEFLNQTPQPPSPESVQAAIDVLCDVGAIDKQVTDTRAFERLTPLGQHLAKLPVDVRLGKMLIFGALFHCIDPVLTIAAGLSSQSPFSTFVKDAAIAKAKQRSFADPDSDFMTYCNVWDGYCQASENSSSAGRKFCHLNYLNFVALREIGDARRQFLDLLCGIGFIDRQAVIGGNGNRLDLKKNKACSFNKHANKPELVHAVICAGLYPHVARLEQPVSGDYTMWHKEERLYFHNSSINSTKKRFNNNESWVVFHEKFGTPNRTSVSTTCFVHPFALLLLGGSVVVKYTDRQVVVDDWIEIGMAAQIGVILRELRSKLDGMLQTMIERANSKQMNDVDSSMIEGIISILVS